MSTPEHSPLSEEIRTQKVETHLQYAARWRTRFMGDPEPDEQICQNASPAFMASDPVVLDVVPIGNQETDETIFQGLTNYATANPGNHYWQVYKLNGSDRTTIRRQSEVMRTFIARNPQVPISFYRQVYYDATITQVRLLGIADSLTTYMALHGGRVDRDFTLLSDDIDFQGGTPDFMATLHRARLEHDAHVVQPHLRHLPDQRFPQMSRVMQIFDDLRCAFPYRWAGARAIGLDDYLAENGFNPTISYGGENELIDRMLLRQQNNFRHHYCDELTAYTSPRKAFHKLQSGRSPEDNMDFNPFQTEVFGAHNTHREASYLEGMRDIPPQDADIHVLDMLAPHRSFYGRRALDAVIWGIMRPKLQHPERVLPITWWPDTEYEREVLFDARRQVREWSLALLDEYPLYNQQAGRQRLIQQWAQKDQALREHLARPTQFQWDHPLVQAALRRELVQP